MKEYDLQFCSHCVQETNHLIGVCQKCKNCESCQFEEGHSQACSKYEDLSGKILEGLNKKFGKDADCR